MTATAVEARPTTNLHVTTTQDTLLDAMKFISVSLPQRTQIPVLAGVRIEGQGDTVKISAFDYEVAAEQVIDATGTGLSLVGGRDLFEIVKDLPKGCQVTLTSQPGPVLAVAADDIVYELPELPIDEYPAMPKPGDKVICDLSSEHLARLLDVCVAAGRDFTLPVLTGVHLSPEAHEGGTTLQAAATDRYRLAVYDTGVEVDKELTPLLIPAGTLAVVAKAFKTGWVRLLLMPSVPGYEGCVTFTDGHRCLTSRMLDGQFPKYRSLMPDPHAATTTVTIDSKLLQTAVKQVSKVASRTSPVRLGAEVTVLAVEAGGGHLEKKATKRLPDIPIDGVPTVWAANPTYLTDGLKVAGDGPVEIRLTGPTKPFVLSKPGDTTFRYLQMPVRLAG